MHVVYGIYPRQCGAASIEIHVLILSPACAQTYALPPASYIFLDYSSHPLTVAQLLVMLFYIIFVLIRLLRIRNLIHEFTFFISFLQESIKPKIKLSIPHNLTTFRSSKHWALFKGLVYFGTFKKSIFIFLHFLKVYVSKNTKQASLIKFR